MITLGSDQRVHRCWLLNGYGFQCHNESTHVVKVGQDGKIMSCKQHLAKAVDMAGRASGQPADKPMIVIVVTVPKPLPTVRHAWPCQDGGQQ